MPKKKYTAEFKTKVILTIIQGDREFNAMCANFNLNPSIVRKWKQEFLQNAHRAFDSNENKSRESTLTYSQKCETIFAPQPPAHAANIP